MDSTFKRPLKLAKAAHLPGLEAGTWYGTPAFLVKGKGFMRVKEADTLVFRCALGEKELLLEAAPNIYFETDHYKGHPVVLVHLSQIADAELHQCIVHAWREVAPRKLVESYRAKPATPRPSAQKTARANGKRKKTREGG